MRQYKTIRVPQDVKTIQEAVDIAEEFTRILVSDGTYEENVVVEVENIDIVGDGCHVVLDGLGLGGSAFTIDNICIAVAIRNFIITNYQVGVNVLGSANTVSNNTIVFCNPSSICHQSEVGVILQGNTNTIVNNDITTKNGFALLLAPGCKANHVANNNMCCKDECIVNCSDSNFIS